MNKWFYGVEIEGYEIEAYPEEVETKWQIKSGKEKHPNGYY